jgi:hypothetical protein
MSKRKPMPQCICEFASCCYGTGALHCRGCGGDFCICRACFGQGETDCDGCEMCGHADDAEQDPCDPPPGCLPTSTQTRSRSQKRKS